MPDIRERGEAGRLPVRVSIQSGMTNEGAEMNVDDANTVTAKSGMRGSAHVNKNAGATYSRPALQAPS